MNTLEICDLNVSFHTFKGIVPAVGGVDLAIPKNKTICIVGESGCGKSMIAFSIMGLIPKPGRIEKGSIRFLGEELTTKSEKDMDKLRGSRISMIFQEPMTSLNPVYTVGKQVAESIRLHEGISAEEAKKRVVQIFQEVGIPEPLKRYNSFPHQLSGGLRQRVMIAMAMICNPDLLIADEPTTALDVTIEAQILKLMQKLKEEKGTSVMLITHNMGVVAEVADEVYVMYAGRVMESANVFTLFENPSHPYSFGLLKSIYSLGHKTKDLYSIRGVVPNLLELPAGCRFCPRCDYTMEICTKKEPPLIEIKPGHFVRCFLYDREVMKND